MMAFLRFATAASPAARVPAWGAWSVSVTSCVGRGGVLLSYLRHLQTEQMGWSLVMVCSECFK